MARTLKAHVHVNDENSQTHVFKPGDTVPAWARKKITHPKAWEGEDEEPEPELVLKQEIVVPKPAPGGRAS